MGGYGSTAFGRFRRVRNDIRAMDNVLSELPHPPLWTIEGELRYYSIRHN